MSRAIFNYNLGEPMKKTEDSTAYDIRKYHEGKNYNTNDYRKFSLLIINNDKSIGMNESQYNFFCNAKNYLEKKKEDLKYITDNIRKLRSYLENANTITDIVNNLLKYNSNIEFSTYVGKFEKVKSDDENYPILKFTTVKNTNYIKSVDFNTNVPNEFLFLKYLLYKPKEINILDLIIIFEKERHNIIIFSATAEYFSVIKSKFPRIVDFNLIEHFSVPLKMYNDNTHNDNSDVSAMGSICSIIYNFSIFKRNEKKINVTFRLGDNSIYNFLCNILLNVFFIKNDETKLSKKELIEIKTGEYVNSVINVKNIIFKIITSGDDVNFIDGIYTQHHELSNFYSPPSFNDYLYDLHKINNKIDIHKTIISYTYFIGHEVAHNINVEIKENYIEYYKTNFFNKEKYKRLLDDPNYIEKYLSYFKLDNIIVKPSNNIKDNESLFKFTESSMNDINTRDTGWETVLSELFADYTSLIFVEKYIIENIRFFHTIEQKKIILEYLYNSICDTYTAQGHADAFVRTNYFVFSKLLSNIMFSNKIDYTKKYLKYKKKYLELKNSFNL